MERRLVPADSPFEANVGYSRAVRVGNQVYVAGTAPIMPGGGEPPADPYGQARRCLEIVLGALAEVGASAEHVVRTRIFITDAAEADEIGRAHGEVFSKVRPATAMIVVSGLLDPRWRVEIEADAVLEG